MGCGASSAQKKYQETPVEDYSSGSTVNLKDGFVESHDIIANRGKNICDHYTLYKIPLGKTGVGRVVKASSKADNKLRAVKHISKKKKGIDDAVREIEILHKMEHRNIVQLYEVYQDTMFFYMVMELCEGGELFDVIVEAGHFNERDAAALMQQVASAVSYLHKSNVVHRDVKPENVLLLKDYVTHRRSKGALKDAVCKLIDFEEARYLPEGEVLSEKPRFTLYSAPEMVKQNAKTKKREYTDKSDVWSLGVMMYIMLCGFPPFKDEHAQAHARAGEGKLEFDESAWKTTSHDARELLKALLHNDPRKRCSAEDALGLAWLKQQAPKADVNAQAGHLKSLKSFKAKTAMPKATLHSVAQQLEEEEIEALRNIFQKMDGQIEGTVTLTQFRNAIEQTSHVPTEELKVIMDHQDGNGSGKIRYADFLADALTTRQHHRETACWTVFRQYDKDHTGDIQRRDLLQVLRDPEIQASIAERRIDEVLTSGVADQEGTITFDEFMTLIGKLEGIR